MASAVPLKAPMSDMKRESCGITMANSTVKEIRMELDDTDEQSCW